MAMIYCPDCGAEISDAAYSCPRCGKPMKPALEATEIQTPADKTPMPPCPETHLAKAIVFTALMCFPFGIPAIVNAAGVHTAYATGNYELAVEKSQKAAKWCKYSLIGGIIFWVLYIAFIALYTFFLIEYIDYL